MDEQTFFHSSVIYVTGHENEKITKKNKTETENNKFGSVRFHFHCISVLVSNF